MSFNNDELINGPFKSIWNVMDRYGCWSDTKTYLRLTNTKKSHQHAVTKILIQ